MIHMCIILTSILFFACSNSNDDFLSPQESLKTEITANTTTEYYSITIQGDEGIASYSGSGLYAAGSTVTVSASPMTGYFFYKWYKDGHAESTNNPYSFTVTNNVTLEAVSTMTHPVNPNDPSEPGSMTLTGKVVDIITREPLYGATVMIYGASNLATATDADGEFSIHVNNYTYNLLLISYIGYQTERIQLSAGNTPHYLRIMLRPSTILEE